MILLIIGIIQTSQPTFDKIGKASIIFAPIINTNPSPAPPPTQSSSASYSGGGAGVGSVSIPVYEPSEPSTTPSTTVATESTPSSSVNKSASTIPVSQKLKSAVIAEVGEDISDWSEYGTVNGTVGEGGGGGGFNVVLPTIRLGQSKVKKGNGGFVYFSGVSSPKNPLTIIVRSGKIISIQTKPQKNGIYRYYLDTSSLEPGVYLVQARSEKDGVSSTDNFIVGEENVVAKSGTGGAGGASGSHLLGDLNDDFQINLADLSILLYWNGKTLPEELRLKMGTKADEVIDMQHFSILVKRWTG